MSTLGEQLWISGAGVQLETSSWKAVRQGFGTLVTPDQTLVGWIHLAMPTPTFYGGVRLKAIVVLLQIATGSACHISNVDVWDGEHRILQTTSNITGPTQKPGFTIPGTPDVKFGITISMEVTFNNTGPDAWCRVIGGGFDFL
jgi:hypothetical protein